MAKQDFKFIAEMGDVADSLARIGAKVGGWSGRESGNPARGGLRRIVFTLGGHEHKLEWKPDEAYVLYLYHTIQHGVEDYELKVYKIGEFKEWNVLIDALGVLKAIAEAEGCAK